MSNCKRDDYFETPPDIFQALNEIFQFELDAAATEQNALVPTKFFSEADDALKQDWSAYAKTVFLNPPFSKEGRKDDFIRKAAAEAAKGVTTVMVLPAKTDTGSFHDSIYRRDDVQVEFLRGRPKFYMNKEITENTGWSPLMLVVFWAEGSLDGAEQLAKSMRLTDYAKAYSPNRKVSTWVEPPAVCEFHTDVKRCIQYNCPPYDK